MSSASLQFACSWSWIVSSEVVRVCWCHRTVVLWFLLLRVRQPVVYSASDVCCFSPTKLDQHLEQLFWEHPCSWPVPALKMICLLVWALSCCFRFDFLNSLRPCEFLSVIFLRYIYYLEACLWDNSFCRWYIFLLQIWVANLHVDYIIFLRAYIQK